jgi:hypothetical protein
MPSLRSPYWRRRRTGKEAMNLFSRWIARNPLKSLDSDERIQGNPRKSNGVKLGF